MIPKERKKLCLGKLLKEKNFEELFIACRG